MARAFITGVLITLVGLFSAGCGSTVVEDVVVLETSQGSIHIKLFPEIAPKACENFVELAESGLFDGTTFHKVIRDVLMEGGDPEGTGHGGMSVFYGQPFEDETDPRLTFERPYLVAMANEGPDTNMSRFFITLAPLPYLNGRHTIFGQVIEGFDTLKKISGSDIDAANRPIREQTVYRVRLKRIANLRLRLF